MTEEIARSPGPEATQPEELTEDAFDEELRKLLDGTDETE